MMYRKIIIVMVVLLVAASAAFAGLGNIDFNNVGFNGTIGPVGTGSSESERAYVKINVTEDRPGSKGYKYTIGSESEWNYISTINLTGNKKYETEFQRCYISSIDINVTNDDSTVVFDNCVIQGQISLKGKGKITFRNRTSFSANARISLSGSVTVEFDNCDIYITDEMNESDGSLKTEGIKASNQFTGSVSFVGDCAFMSTNLSLGFQNSQVTSLSLASVSISEAYRLKKVDLSNCSKLTNLALDSDHALIDLLDMKNATGMKEHMSCLFDVNASTYKWTDRWKIKKLILSEIGFNAGVVDINDQGLIEIYLSGNSITQLMINDSESFRSEHTKIKTLKAENCGIQSCKVWVQSDSAPESGIYLANNRLGERHDTVEIKVYKEDDTSYMGSSTGSNLNTAYYRVYEDGVKPEYNDDGEQIGYETKYSRDIYYNFHIGKNITINGTSITTYFDAGNNISRSQITYMTDSYNSTEKTDKLHLQCVDDKSSYMRFCFNVEWTSALRNLNLDLSGNGICYKAGTSDRDETNCKMLVGFHFWIQTKAKNDGLRVGVLDSATQMNTQDDLAMNFDVNGGADFWECKNVSNNAKRYLYGNGKYIENSGSQQSSTLWANEVNGSNSSDGFSSMRIYIKHITTLGDSRPRNLKLTIYPCGE